MTLPLVHVWAVNEKLTSAQINLIAAYLSCAVDGSFGGTYAPSAPIIFGGAGIRIDTGASLTALSGSSVAVNSGANLQMGGSLNLGVSGTFITNAASTFTNHGTISSDGTIISSGTLQVLTGTFAISTGVSATCASPITFFGAGKVVTPGSSININDASFPTYVTPVTIIRSQPLIVGFMSGPVLATGGGVALSVGASDSVEFILTEVQDGATMTGVSFTVLGQTHVGTPATHPTVSFTRVNRTTGAVDNLRSAGSYDFVSMTAINGRNITSILFDQNNVIDRSTYYYMATIHPESGANALLAVIYPMGLSLTIAKLNFG